MRVTYQKELFFKLMPEFPPLFHAEWEEASQGKEHRQMLDPAWDQYVQMEMQGLLLVLTARDKKELVGYCISVIHPHLHFSNTLYAFVDGFYLLPAHRRDGIDEKMIAENEKLLRDAKVARINMAINPSLWLYKLMKRMQYVRTECILSKWL